MIATNERTQPPCTVLDVTVSGRSASARHKILCRSRDKINCCCWTGSSRSQAVVVLDALSLPPSSGQVNHIPQLQNPFHISSNGKEEPKNAVQVAQTRSVRLAASPFNDFYVVLRRVYKLAHEQSKSPSRIPPVSFINTRLGQKKEENRSKDERQTSYFRTRQGG